MTSNRPLKAILSAAHKEADAMEHDYLGVEHVFLALIRQADSSAHKMLLKQDIPPQDVIDYVYRYSEGDKRHLWDDRPYTRRLEVVLGIADDIALDDGRKNHITEADVWQAILEEKDSLPMHILRRMGF